MASKKSTKKCVRKEERRNAKLWAEGTRESILAPHVEAYADALVRGWRAEHDYIQQVGNEYHALINWRLEDHEEPELPLPVYGPDDPVVPEQLTEEEQVEKRRRIAYLNEVRTL